jgi:hypothetical protein
MLTININKCAVLSLFSKPQPTLNAYFIVTTLFPTHQHVRLSRISISQSKHYAVKIYYLHPSSSITLYYNMELLLYLFHWSDWKCSAQIQYPTYHFPKGSFHLTLIYLNGIELDLILSITIQVFNYLSLFNSSKVFNIYSSPTCFKLELPYLLETIHSTNQPGSNSFFSKCRCVECPLSRFAFYIVSPYI